nr:hypothetical protein [uncultured Desulfobulbus sp.]
MKNRIIRIPTVNNFGINYNPTLVNIILLSTEIGCEDKVVNDINVIIDRYENNLFNLTRSNSESYDSIFSHDKNYYYTQLIGKFSLALIFPSKSFGISEDVSSVENITSNHTIIGSIPMPVSDYRGAIKFINNNINNIFINNENENRFPFLGICQAQRTGIVNTSFGGCITLPLMKAVDTIVEKLIKKYNNSTLSINYIDAFNWSDSCFVIRSNDINLIAEIVDRIRSVNFIDINESIGELESYKDNPCIESTQHSFERIDRILHKISSINGREIKDKPTLLDNHIFTQSLTMCGIAWKLVKEFYKIGFNDYFHKINLIGEVFLETRLKIRPGHDSVILNFLNNLTSDDNIKKIIHYENRSFLFGESSLLILWYRLDETGVKKPVDIKTCLKCLFVIRNNFLVKSAHDDDININSLIEMNSEIQVVLDERAVCYNAKKIVPINSLYGKSVLMNKHLDIDRISLSLKKKKISRYLRRALVNRLTLWREKLIDHTMSNQMVELLDFYIAWKKILDLFLENPKKSVYDIESHIKFFIKPFGSSLSQRYLESSKMIFSNDLSMEFKGGFSKILTGLDGFSKSCLSLISDPNDNGSMTILGVNSNAKIKFKFDGTKDFRKIYNLSSVELNRDHLVHPLKVTTFLHENIHVLVGSYDFDCLIQSHNKTFYYEHNEESSIGVSKFLNHRIDEMTTELMLAYLVYSDNPDLYCKVQISKLIVDSEFNYNNEVNNKNFDVRFEHVLRCYLVYKMLVILKGQCVNLGSKFNIDDEEFFKILADGFDEWYLKFYKYFKDIGNNSFDFDSNTFKSYLFVGFLNRNKFMKSIKTIIVVTFEFFNKEINYNFKIRKRFVETLFETMEMTLNDTKKMLSGLNGGSSPVNFYFSTKLNRLKTRNYRIRRLESLIGYLVIIRSFHEIIDSWLKLEENENIFINRDENGDIDMRIHYSYVAFDRSWGSIFISNNRYLDKYTSLRIAFFKSMWHISEITKHSDMMNLLKSSIAR